MEKELWSHQQYCDRRWIIPFDLPASAKAHSNMRRCAKATPDRNLYYSGRAAFAPHVLWRRTAFRLLLRSESFLRPPHQRSELGCPRRWGRSSITCVRWSTGRIVVDSETLNDNVWINTCELSLAGRPLNEHKQIGMLPYQRDLLLPESTNADEDRSCDSSRFHVSVHAVPPHPPGFYLYTNLFSSRLLHVALQVVVIPCLPSFPPSFLQCFVAYPSVTE